MPRKGDETAQGANCRPPPGVRKRPRSAESVNALKRGIPIRGRRSYARGPTRRAPLIHRDPKATSRRLTRRAVAVRVGVLFLSAAIVGAVALRLPSRPPPTPLTFVDRALGSPSSDASLERRLATGAILAIDALGINARVGSATIALASRNAGHGSWHRYGSGVMRATNFGRESILFGINRAEQFLTVNRPQGARTWSRPVDA